MSIGNTIRRLRRERDMTQEQLAEYLGITSRAVSQWECEKTAPDLSQIPVLAHIFEVTADELLGIDTAKEEVKIREILLAYEKLSRLGKEKEKFDLIAEAYRSYPKNWLIVDKRLDMLCYDPYHGNNGLLIHEEEILTLCNRILDKCPQDSIRYSALSVLGGLYRDKGEIDKALEMANRFPPYYMTSGEERENTYQRGTDEWWQAVRDNIAELTDQLYVKLRNCALYCSDGVDAQLHLFAKAEALLTMIYEDGDLGFNHYFLTELYLWMANRYAMKQDWENGARYLERGLSHAKAYDALSGKYVHTSYPVRGHVLDTDHIYSGYEGNEMKRELAYLAECTCWDAVREEPWYRDILAKYEPYVSDTKGNVTVE